MKFGKLLKDLTEGNPQMSEQPLIRYKELKKHLKNIKKNQDQPGSAGQQAQTAAAAGAPAPAPQPDQQDPPEQHEQQTLLGQELPPNLSAEEQAFINMLNEDLLSFNRFFMDKEEEAVIKLQALADRIAGAQGLVQETQELKAALVDFHGEMVLLLHWSLLNYAAVVKILKKHDKTSGLLLRAPYLANVLQQPFYSTSVMSRLVKMAEGHIESLVAQEAQQEGPAASIAAAAQQQAEGGSRQAPPEAAAAAGAGPSAEAAAAEADFSNHADSTQEEAAAAAAAGARAAAGPELESDTDTEEVLAGTAVCARTRVALQTWQQLSSNASTPSTVLPATSSHALVRALNVRQRWAKIVSMAPIMQQAGMEAGAAADGADMPAEAAAAAGAGQFPGREQSAAAQVAPQAQQQQQQQQQQAPQAAVQQDQIRSSRSSQQGPGVHSGQKHKAEDQQLQEQPGGSDGPKKQRTAGS